jgi:hypothetical protein
MSMPITPKERYRRVLRGEKPDRIPLHVGNYSHFLSNYYGLSIEEYLDSPEAAAAVTVRFILEFKVDCNMVIGNSYVYYGCGPEIGVKWAFPENQVPASTEGFIKTRADVDRFIMPSTPSGYFKKFCEIIRRVNSAVGETVHLQSSLLGPFSVACFIRGVQETLLDIYDDPSFYLYYMPLCVELSKYFGTHMFATGLERPHFNEIFVVPEAVRPDKYHEFIAPFDQKVVDFFGPGRLNNTFSVFMGQPENARSQQEARAVWDAFWGTGESLETLEKGVKCKIPGFPMFLTLSGRAFYSWTERELLDFLSAGTDLLVRKYQVYPAISLTSILPDSKEKAQQMAEKIRMVNEFRNRYVL